MNYYNLIISMKSKTVLNRQTVCKFKVRNDAQPMKHHKAEGRTWYF